MGTQRNFSGMVGSGCKCVDLEKIEAGKKSEGSITDFVVPMMLMSFLSGGSDGQS